MKETFLFKEKSIEEMFEEHNKRIMDRLSSIECSEDTNVKELSEEIYQENKVNNISLEMDGMKVIEKDDSHTKVGIPIREGRELLVYKPTNEYGSVHPAGAVEDHMITKVFGPVEDERTKRQMELWKNVLDVYVTSLDEDIVHYHKHLLKDIEDRVSRRKEECTS